MTQEEKILKGAKRSLKNAIENLKAICDDIDRDDYSAMDLPVNFLDAAERDIERGRDAIFRAMDAED